MSDSGLKFTPPVGVQRHQVMKDLVSKVQPKKVIDMGCGECSLLRQLKHVPGLHQLTGVDVERTLLEASRDLIKPLTYDFLQPRSHPFSISLYEGSIGMKDGRMLGYDLCICVEVIEHLYPATLASLPEVLFGFMQPKTVAITTPNADFNVLFPDFRGFRHPDHKFEWTREEFQTWGDQVAMDYGYTVTYEGIGAGPPGSEHLGCCTQMGIFTRTRLAHEGSRPEDVTSAMPYVKVCEVEYPHRAITATTEEQILSEALLYLRRLARRKCLREESEDEPYSQEANEAEAEAGEAEESQTRRTASVALETMMGYSCLRRVCPSTHKLREVLETCDAVTWTEDRSVVLFHPDEDRTDDRSSPEEWDAPEEGDEVTDDVGDQESYASPWQQEEESWD